MDFIWIMQPTSHLCGFQFINLNNVFIFECGIPYIIIFHQNKFPSTIQYITLYWIKLETSGLFRIEALDEINAVSPDVDCNSSMEGGNQL